MPPPAYSPPFCTCVRRTACGLLGDAATGTPLQPGSGWLQRAADLIAEMRRRRGLSQAALARRSGIPRSAITAYESGARTPVAATLLRLAEACGFDLKPVEPLALDLQRNARALEQALDLAELLPRRRRSKRLECPPLVSV